MIVDNKIQIGTGRKGPAYLLPTMATRHGLISGATGTGKTVCMKLLAEGFSSIGVPVFITDIKGDLGGTMRAGVKDAAINERLTACGINPEAFECRSFPTIFWDAFGEDGHPLRTTVDNVDPLLMARMLELNETQASILEIVYKISREQGYFLEDLKDLRSLLIHIGNNTDKYEMEYGYMASKTIGVIQRQVYQMEEYGGSVFFGQPAINILDWFAVDQNKNGFINILSASRLFYNTQIYSTFMLWLLTELNRVLPERGDAEKPFFAIFLDEAHLMFKNTSKRLITKIEQLIRLMRSKGVAVFMQTWNPLEIPASVSRQLHNRIQMSMNTYTPLEQQSVQSLADCYPLSPDFDIYQAINALGIGEAIVSLLKEDGTPDATDKVTILPPQSRMGIIDSETRRKMAHAGPLHGKYDELIDYYSAYEKLNPNDIVTERKM